METLVGNHYKVDHYHDASEHGLTWALLNELLHVIVFVYTLYGMIQFKVKFIHQIRLVRAVSVAIIAHSWYLCMKFALIAIVLYLFVDELEVRNISLLDYNCTLANHARVFEANGGLQSAANYSNSSHTSDPMSPGHRGPIDRNYGTISTKLKYLTDLFIELDYPQLWAQFLHTYGGPFKLLGNRATLMYGFYSIAIYIMLAIFPIELMYLKVGFNFIRFVLNDTSCMRELYINRSRHLSRLASWSRNQTDSELTLGSKSVSNQPDVRSRFTDDYCLVTASQLAELRQTELDLVPEVQQPRPTVTSPSSSSDKINTSTGDETKLLVINEFRRARRLQRRNAIGTSSCHVAKMSRFVMADHKLAGHLKPLRKRLAINHRETPSYSVQVANRNLEKFKPFVRSETWFKSSMIFYPVAIFFYFALLLAIIATISIFFVFFLKDVGRACASKAGANHQASTGVDEIFNWSDLDLLTYLETQYAVFALSCASSFYCSYYFGTMSELHIWILELSQQLELCKIVVELSNEYCYKTSGRAANTRRPVVATNEAVATRPAGKELDHQRVHRLLLDNGKLLNLDEVTSSRLVHRAANDFGGIRSLWQHAKLFLFAKQSDRLKLSELVAIRLLSKKQTHLRATYINMCLFFDELNATRFMTNTILRRTTQIAFGFAMMASITRSQFQSNYLHLTLLLLSCLLILNCYLAYAAIINTCINRLLVQVHSLISASLKTGSEDADLFEFWVRHIRSFGEDKDAMSYKIYGYKITWATTLNVGILVSHLTAYHRLVFILFQLRYSEITHRS